MKPIWQAVLERGVLNYFASRADSTLNSDQNKRRDYKYLDSARVTPLSTDSASFVVHFSDGSAHRLSVLAGAGDRTLVDRQVTRESNFVWNSLNYVNKYLYSEMDKRIPRACRIQFALSVGRRDESICIGRREWCCPEATGQHVRCAGLSDGQFRGDATTTGRLCHHCGSSQQKPRRSTCFAAAVLDEGRAHSYVIFGKLFLVFICFFCFNFEFL